MTISLSESDLRFVAAIFDFDETLVNLEREHDAAADALCRERGDDYLAMPEAFRHSSGRRVVDEVDEMRRFFGWPVSTAELYQRRQNLFMAACRSASINPMPGAVEAVRVLHARGLRLAIASSGIFLSIDEILSRLGVRDLFSVIVAGEHVERGKPDPETYFTAAGLLSVDPAECVVFEDSSVGVRAAKAAGMYCLAVRNPEARIRQDLSAADMEVDRFDDVDLAALVAGSRDDTAVVELQTPVTGRNDRRSDA